MRKKTVTLALQGGQISVVFATGPIGGAPEQFYDLIRREITQWRQVIVHAGVRIDSRAGSMPKVTAAPRPSSW